MFVRWKQRALDHLADIYVALPLAEQRLLAADVEMVNRELLARGGELGESRGGTRRMWFTEWLVVSFNILPNGGVDVSFVSDNRR